MQTITFKRGDSFFFYATIPDDDGNPLVDAVDKIKSQVRNSIEGKICDMTVEATGTPGEYKFTAPATDKWPVTTLYLDIEINKKSSETLAIKVERDVTMDD